MSSSLCSKYNPLLWEELVSGSRGERRTETAEEGGRKRECADPRCRCWSWRVWGTSWWTWTPIAALWPARTSSSSASKPLNPLLPGYPWFFFMHLCFSCLHLAFVYSSMLASEDLSTLNPMGFYHPTLNPPLKRICKCHVSLALCVETYSLKDPYFWGVFTLTGLTCW